MAGSRRAVEVSLPASVASHLQRWDSSAHQPVLVPNWGHGEAKCGNKRWTLGKIRDTCTQMRGVTLYESTVLGGGGDLKLCPSNPKFQTLFASGITCDSIECTEHVGCRALRRTQTFWTTVLVVQHTCQVDIWDHPTSRQELWQLQVHTESHV